MVKVMTPDTYKRIQQHILNLGSEDMPIVHKAEKQLLRFGKKAIGQLIEVLLSDNSQVRLYAVYLLGKTGEPEMLPVILRFINDPDEYVRYDAVMALGYLGNPKAIPVLQEVANHKHDPANVSSAACTALAMLGIWQEQD